MTDDTTGTRGNVMKTVTGQFDFDNIEHNKIELADIIAGISCACRWGGQFGWCSVSEHLLLCVDYAEKKLKITDPTALIAILFHDAAESYTGDIKRPLKRKFPELSALEERILRHIFRTFLHLDYDTHKDIVKTVDNTVLFAEKRQYMPFEPIWPNEELYPKINLEIDGYDPKIAAKKFLRVYHDLAKVLTSSPDWYYDRGKKLYCPIRKTVMVETPSTEVCGEEG